MKPFLSRINAWLRLSWTEGDSSSTGFFARDALTFFALALVFFAASWLRFHTYHNTTFDLAFYARICWAMSRFQGWEPITNADFFGLHLSWVLWPLAFVGRMIGQVPVLLLAQSCALAAVIFPLHRSCRRSLGDSTLARVAPVLFFLHPNVFAVASAEFHPGSLGVLPMFFLLDAVDRKSVRGFLLFSTLTLLCREDFALLLLAACIVFFVRTRQTLPRQHARWLLAWSVGLVVYFAVFVFVLQPRFGPRHAGSLQLHFGDLGSSSSEIVGNVVRNPSRLIRHLWTPERLWYLPKVLAPFLFLPLLFPVSLVVVAPVLLVNLVSGFPTTMDVTEHYLTPAVPGLVWGSLHAIRVLRERFGARVAHIVTGALLLAAAVAHCGWGTSPFSRTFVLGDFVADARTLEAERVVSLVGDHASVQAPDVLLPHLAERLSIRRAPPPEHRSDFVVFDVSHRIRFGAREELVRTDEETLLRAWLAKADHALVFAGSYFYMFQRNREPRTGVAFRTLQQSQAAPDHVRLCECLSLVRAEETHGSFRITLRALGVCPADLALRVGVAKRPRHVFLLGNGALPPSQLRTGDTWTETISLPGTRLEELRVGAIRASGARPAWTDPTSVRADTASSGVGAPRAERGEGRLRSGFASRREGAIAPSRKRT